MSELHKRIKGDGDYEHQVTKASDVTSSMSSKILAEDYVDDRRVSSKEQNHNDQVGDYNYETQKARDSDDNRESSDDEETEEESKKGDGMPGDSGKTASSGQGSESDEDELEGRFAPDRNAASVLGQASDKTSEAIDAALSGFKPRWRNYIVRCIFTFVMISGFFFIIWIGPLAVVLLVMVIQIKIFQEIIKIGHVVYKSQNLPWFRTLSWYFLVSSNYFFYGESMCQHFGVLLSSMEFGKLFVTYHRFISFSLYVAGIVGFVISLKKRHYLKQFTLFGFTHVTLLLVTTQANLMIQTVFEGLIWFFVPVSMIINNDIWAYLFGFFFGKTPLIKVSPKKTWEGFIGGAVATVIWGLLVSQLLVQYDYFVCPIEYDEVKQAISMECTRSAIFRPTQYNLPSYVVNLGLLIGQEWTTITLHPFVLHSISLSLFASVIGPFGGFFASGFKRAFKIKDFGDMIPGHGGLTDRFDCQLVMATFVHVYHSSFIQTVSPQKLVTHIMALKPDEQLQVFQMLKDALIKQRLL